jgi:predicted metal-dependent peptidase
VIIKQNTYKQNPTEVLSRAIIQLIFKEPFYGHVMQSLPRSFSNAIPTAAVGIKNGLVEMLFNADFFINELNTSERVAVLKHEILHIVFRHLYRNKKYAEVKLIYNIAADLVVNQYIGNWQLPVNSITINSFPDLKLKEKQSIEYYIEKLLNIENGKLSLIISANYFDSHNSMWDEMSNETSDSSKDIAAYKLDRIIIDSFDKATNSKDKGDIPLEIKQAIFKIQASYKSNINWRKSLKIFAQHSMRTSVFLTHNRISKRFKTRPGVKIKRSEKLLLAIDTSGSISQKELDVFFTEINLIYKCGAEIDIVECDAKIQDFYKYKGVYPEYVKGRGGTDFDPVFEFINKGKLNYDGCIYLTDGYASEPKIKCPIKLLWVVTTNINTSHLIKGKIIKLNIND